MYCNSDHLVVIDYQINVGHVYNTCLRQTKSLTLFQICNMICTNEIHMSTGEGAFLEWGMFENAICRSEVVSRYSFMNSLLMTKFMFDIFRMHV